MNRYLVSTLDGKINSYKFIGDTLSDYIEPDVNINLVEKFLQRNGVIYISKTHKNENSDNIYIVDLDYVGNDTMANNIIVYIKRELRDNKLEYYVSI